MEEQGSENKVEVPEKKPFRLRYRIETPRGIYEINRPLGRYGSVHFALLSRCMPDTYDVDGSPLYKGNVKVEFAEVFKDWSIQVLKHVVHSYPVVDGKQLTYETMPGEDQYAIFMMMAQETDTSSGSFRMLD
jgi:hypothetical protein